MPRTHHFQLHARNRRGQQLLPALPRPRRRPASARAGGRRRAGWVGTCMKPARRPVSRLSLARRYVMSLHRYHPRRALHRQRRAFRRGSAARPSCAGTPGGAHRAHHRFVSEARRAANSGSPRKSRSVFLRIAPASRPLRQLTPKGSGRMALARASVPSASARSGFSSSIAACTGSNAPFHKTGIVMPCTTARASPRARISPSSARAIRSALLVSPSGMPGKPAVSAEQNGKRTHQAASLKITR